VVQVPVREAICQGIDEEMARDPAVYVMGERYAVGQGGNAND